MAISNSKRTRTLLIKNALIPTTTSSSSLVEDGHLYDIECFTDKTWSSTPSKRIESSVNLKGKETPKRIPFASVSTLERVENEHVTQQTTEGAKTLAGEGEGEEKGEGEGKGEGKGESKETSWIIDAKGSLTLIGGLIHPHVHLDKCYLMDECKLTNGSFKEALKETNKAKRKFSLEDLHARGTRLVQSSLLHGVTAMRAHVEIDPTVCLFGFKAGCSLKEEYSTKMSIQLVAFAQEPFFYPSSPATEANMTSLFDSVISIHNHSPTPILSAIGSAPYVEESHDAALRNVARVFSLAKRAAVDVDFHLDYNLDESTPTLLWEVLRSARRPGNSWLVGGRKRRITLGHCTKLGLFSESDWNRLTEEYSKMLGEVFFVSLPTSDLYMQGRDIPYKVRSRATLPGLELARRGISCAVGVNNVENLFTPQGDADPLALLPLLVGLWQNAKPEAIRYLIGMITDNAALAAGLDSTPAKLNEDENSTLTELKRRNSSRREWDHAQLAKDLSKVHVQETEKKQEPSVKDPLPAEKVTATAAAGIGSFTIIDGCQSLRDLVLSPAYGRTTIFEGRMVSRRTVHCELMP